MPLHMLRHLNVSCTSAPGLAAGRFGFSRVFQTHLVMGLRQWYTALAGPWRPPRRT